MPISKQLQDKIYKMEQREGVPPDLLPAVRRALPRAMTVRELMAELEKVQDKEMPVYLELHHDEDQDGLIMSASYLLAAYECEIQDGIDDLPRVNLCGSSPQMMDEFEDEYFSEEN